MQDRAISAAVLVPVLLVVLLFGGIVFAGFVAIITAIAAVEVFRLFRATGSAPFTALGVALALVVVLDAAFPEVFEGSGMLLAGVGIVLVGVASFTKIDPRDGLQSWMATIFGAFSNACTSSATNPLQLPVDCETASANLSIRSPIAPGACSTYSNGTARSGLYGPTKMSRAS